MKILRLFLFVIPFLLEISSELVYNPEKSVVIKESEKTTCFVRQTDTVRASVGVRIPKFTNFTAFNSSTGDCGFKEDTFDADEANSMIKNIIKIGLGFKDDFLERPDPFHDELLLIKPTKNNDTLYPAYEKQNLKLTKNEGKIQPLTGKITMTVNDQDTEKNLLTDGNTSTLFRFNCKNIEKYKVINIHVKTKFISRLRMVFLGPVPALSSDIVHRNLKVYFFYGTSKHDFIKCRLITVGQETSFPSIDAVCKHTAEMIESTKQFSKEIKIQFQFTSAKTYEKKIYCESLQIREMFLYEIENPKRKKRQALAMMGGSLLGYMGSEILNHYLNKGLLEHKNNLIADVNALKVENIENLQTLKSILKTTELYYENNDEILKKMSKTQCHENFLNRKIEFFEFLHILTNEFMTSLNFSLLNIINRIPKNQVILLAEKLCRGLNKNVDVALCHNYYKIENKYKIISIEPSGFTGGKTGTIIINVKVEIPFFMKIETKTFNLISIPKPLYSTENLNHFQVSKIPKNIVEIKSINDRKIEISDDCIETDNIFYCNYDILNLLHDKGNLCVNSLFANTTTSCESIYLRSFTNCMINPISDSILYISHVGKVEIIDTDFSISGIHLLNKETITLDKTNITILSGPTMRKNYKIRCSASEYNHFENLNAVAEEIIINTYENISNNYGHLYNNFERFSDLSKMNTTELTKIIGQLDNINEKILRDVHAHEIQKTLKVPYIPENFISSAYELSSKLLPFFAITNTIFLIFIFHKLIKYFIKRVLNKIAKCLNGYKSNSQEEHQVIQPN